MAKRTSAWTPLAAAVLAVLQVYGCAVAGNAGDNQNAGHLRWQLADRGGVGGTFDPGFRYGEGHGVAVDDARGGSAADGITVRTALTADGKEVEVGVALLVPINRDVVWAVMNDYENMPRFVPDIHATRLISAVPGGKRVEIEGVMRLLFMVFPVNTTLDVVYLPDGSIAIDSVAGNLAIHGVVRVHGEGPSTRVDYQVRMAPDFWVPPLIGDYLIGRQIRRQFEGMVAEMHRRANGHPTRGMVDRRPGSAAHEPHAGDRANNLSS